LSLLPLLLLILFPVAVYCVVLAYLNRRLQPTPVPGAWDFLALLFAASGLLLFAGPEVINAYFRKSIEDTAFAEGGPSPRSVEHLRTLWWAVWAAYYAAVLTGAAALVWLRADKLVVYNIAPADFERALEQALARLKIGVARTENRLFLGSNGPPVAEPIAEPQLTAVSVAPLTPAAESAAVPARSAAGEAVLDIDPFVSLWNVTLAWRNHSGALRREVEAELARELREVRTYDNPVGSWFLGVAGFLFALIFMVLMAVLLAPLLQPQR
jgi:hypothetical protein